MKSHLLKLVAAASLLAPLAALAQELPPQDVLVGRPLVEAVETLSARVKANDADQAARFALGMAQALHAVERTAGAFYEHGLMQTSVSQNLQIFGLPVPSNPTPKPTSAEDVDRILTDFSAGLAEAAKTLEGVTDPSVKVPVKVGLIRVDLNGAATGGEMSAWELMAEIGGIGRGDDEFRQAAEQFAIGFDLGDAHWLRGYCNLIGATADIMAAFDKRELHDRAGHLIFANAKSSYPFLRDGQKVFEVSPDVDIVDAIAFIHLLNFPVRDADRLKSARQKLLTTIACSEESWRAILAEADDDAEWIPNPNQATVVPGIRVEKEMIDAWLAFVADGREVLEGRRLVPFWRGTGGQGVNFKRAFDEPQPFDLVLWVQGTAAAPYLEQGPLANANTLRQLERLLGGRVFMFAVWVN